MFKSRYSKPNIPKHAFVLSRKDFFKALELLRSKKLLMMILTQYYCVMRPSEMRKIRIDNIDVNEHTIMIEEQDSKSRKPVLKFIPDAKFRLGNKDYSFRDMIYKWAKEMKLLGCKYLFECMNLSAENREIKRRVKWFSTFQSLDGANDFFSLWFHHWNQRHSD